MADSLSSVSRTNQSTASSAATHNNNKKIKCTPLKMVLIGVVTLVIVACIVGTIVLLTWNMKEDKKETKSALKNDSTQEVITTEIPTATPLTKNRCETPGCIKYLYNMADHMNTDQDACEDPYDLACRRYVHSNVFVTERMKKMLEDNSTQYEGPMKYAKKLFDLCEAGKTDGSKSCDSHSLVPDFSDEDTATEYQEKLAKAGVTNLGIYKLDLERLSDPNDMSPKSVLVIQKIDGFDLNEGFGYVPLVRATFTAQFDEFDSIENRMESKDELVQIKDIYEPIPQQKKDRLMVFLKGWFPEGTSEELIKANVWTYKYEYWTSPPSIHDEMLFKYDYGIKKFHNEFALQAINKSLHDAIYTPQDCYKMVVNTIPQAFARYTEKDEEHWKIGEINNITDKYKKKSVEVLKAAKMDEPSRGKLIDRVEQFNVVVGYPKEWKDNLDLGSILDGRMNDLNTACPEVRRWQVLQHFKYLANPKDHYPAFYGFYASKTYYNTKDNILHLHPSLLDDPFFDDTYFNGTYPSFVQYSGFGQVIGKGVSDAIAQLYREEGSTGVSKEAKDAYKATSDCFAGQGQTAVDEAITDNIGTLISYQLMTEEDEWKAAEGKELLMRGPLKFNNAHWFFIAAAERICVSPLEGLSTKTSAGNDLKTIGKERIKGLMANLPQYTNTFNCTVSTPMRPTQQCHLY